MKYKGIEIGTPTVDQIQECINSFGLGFLLKSYMTSTQGIIGI